MAITADIALLSPAPRHAALASPGAGSAFAAALGQVSVVRGAQSKLVSGPGPTNVVTDDHPAMPAATQSDVPHKAAASTVTQFTALSSVAEPSPAPQAAGHLILPMPSRPAYAFLSSTIQPNLAQRASPALTRASTPPSVFGAVVAPSGSQPGRKDTLATTTGLATIVQPVAESEALLPSPLSGPPSPTAIPSAPAQAATVATRQATEATKLTGNSPTSPAKSLLAPRLIATVQTDATARASATPSAWQAQPMPASQFATTSRPRGGSTTLQQGSVSGLPAPGAHVSAPVMRTVSATATAVRTSKTIKPLNAAATPQAQTLPAQPSATMANAAILPLAVVVMDSGRPVAGATAAAIPLSLPTVPLGSGTFQNGVTPVIDAAAVPQRLAGPTTQPDPSSLENTASTSSPHLPALPVATRDPPSPAILVLPPAAAVSPRDASAARPIATPVTQPIGLQDPRQAATVVPAPAAHMAAATSLRVTRQPAISAAASIAVPQPSQTVRTPPAAPQAAAAPADASTKAAAKVLAAPVADGMPAPTAAVAPLSVMPEPPAAVGIAPLPPSTVNQAVAPYAPPPSAVGAPPAGTSAAPPAKIAHIASATQVARIEPTRPSSPAATGTAAARPTTAPSDPTSKSTASAPGRTPAAPGGNSASTTRDKAATATEAGASPSASPAPQAPLVAPTPQADMRDPGLAPRQPDKDTQTAATTDAGPILGTSASTTTTTAPNPATPAAQPASGNTPPAPTQAPPPAAQLADAAANLHVGADGTSHVTIRLDPAELGHVQIRISRATDGTASIDVAVERPDTLATLQNDLGHLHQALDRAGVPDQRSVTMHLAAQPDQGGSTSAGANTGSGSGFSPQGGFQQGARQQHQAAGQAPTPAAAMPDGASIPRPPRPAAIAGSGVNITA